MKPILLAMTAGLLSVAPGVWAAPQAATFAPLSFRPVKTAGIPTLADFPIPLAANPKLINPANVPEGGSGVWYAYQTYFQLAPQQTLRGNEPETNYSGTMRPFHIQGTIMVRDGSGSRVFEHQLINDNGVNRNVYNLFVAGDTWYRQEAGMANAAVQPLAYLGLRPAGIEEFLVGVRMKGIVKGEAMAELLRRTGAIQNGTDRDGKKATARSIVYRIPATPYDEARGYQSLMVWVRVGDFKLVRTALALPVGTERTDYQNIIDGRHFPEAIFTLPGETAEDLGRLNIPQ